MTMPDNVKKLLILGGSSQVEKVIKTAKKLDIYTIIVDININSPAKKYADEFINMSVTDTEEIIRYCKNNDVYGVINYNIDPAQTTHEEVCRKLNFPCYGSLDAYRTLANKEQFILECQKFGLDVIPKYTKNDVICYPVLVKPAESCGGMGITICYDKDDLSTAIDLAEKKSRNGCYIIEKYMNNCPDLHVMYYVIDGIPNLIRVADRYTGNEEDGLSRQCICAFQPSKYTSFYVSKYDAKMKDFIVHIGVKNGPVSFQGFIDGEIIRWYDPAIRFPGGNYDLFFKEINGIDLVQCTIEYALSGKMVLSQKQLDNAYLLKGYHAVQLDIDVGPGTIMAIEGIEQVRCFPEVVSVVLWRQLGDVVEKTGDVKQRLAEIAVFSKEGPDYIVNLIKRIQKLIKVYDENGKDIVISPMDTDVLFDEN